jgi:chorismate mutase
MIDVIDKQIMDLLDQRFALTTEIGVLKKEVKMVVLDENRESIIYNNASKYSHSPQIKVIYKTIMEESKSLQGK